MKKLMVAIIMMAGAAALSASELETQRAGSELTAIGAEALGQVEAGAVPAPKPENAGQATAGSITAGYLDMDVATMEKLYMGYLVLEARSVYEAGDPNADLLLKLRGNSFVARGMLMTSLKKKFPFRTVCNVYLKTLPGQDPAAAVFLRSKTFFSEGAAKEYQKSLATDATVKVYFTVHYNYREITESPFEISSIEMPWSR